MLFYFFQFFNFCIYKYIFLEKIRNGFDSFVTSSSGFSTTFSTILVILDILTQVV